MKYLSKSARKLWKTIHDEYVLESHQVHILDLACTCLDRISQAQAQLLKDGLFFKNKAGSIKQHPAINVENSNKSQYRLLMRELGLDIEVPDTRPKRGHR